MYKRLDISKIENRIIKFISSEDALKDVTPIQWSDDVFSGKKKVIISKVKKTIADIIIIQI